MNLKKIGKVFTSKFVGTGSSSFKKIIYRAAVSQKKYCPNRLLRDAEPELFKAHQNVTLRSKPGRVGVGVLTVAGVSKTKVLRSCEMSMTLYQSIWCTHPDMLKS
jgi:hypothetical protein